MEVTLRRLRLKFTKRLLTHRIFAFPIWAYNKFQSPSPYAIKYQVLKKYGIKETSWIETGTYLGETTRFLAKNYPSVLSLEPSIPHFQYGLSKFRKNRKIKLINKTSEEFFETALLSFNEKLNIYLDGHASGDGTFTGVSRTPVRHELEMIAMHRLKFNELFVAIDDFRVFKDTEGTYPTNHFLVDFCKLNGFDWTVEQDIFLFWSRESKKLD